MRLWRTAIPIIALWCATSSAFAQAGRPPPYYLSQLLDVSISAPANSQALIYDSTLAKWKNGAGGGGGTGANLTVPIVQTAHGLAVKDVVRFNGTNYVKAQADTAADAEVVGIVSAVTDANNFTLLLSGNATGLSGFTAGTTYFLSPTVAGGLTSTGPSTVGQISKPLLTANTVTSGYFTNWRGITNVTPLNAFGTVAVSGQSNVVANASPDTLTLAAGTNVTLTTNAGTKTVTIASSGGTGTVTSFSSGNLPPIFTTSVATSTTTPALSFTLSGTPAGHQFLGNNTGAGAAPTYVQPNFTDLAGFATTAQAGVPTGGTAAQVLQKNSATNYDTSWITQTTTSESIWNYKNVVTMADPSTGNVRVNNAAFGSATAMAISKNDFNGTDRTPLLASLQIGDIIEVQDQTAATNWARYNISAAVVNNSTWFQIPISFVTGSGTNPSNNDNLLLTFNTSGGGGGAGVVSSVFGRTGAVVATSGDYSFSLLSGNPTGAQLNLTGTAPIVWTSGTSTLSLNVGVDHAFTAAQSIKISDAATNTVVDSLSLGHNSSSAGAASFGSGLLLLAKDSTTADVNAGEIQSLWTTATHNSNVSDMVFRLTNGSTSLAEAFRVTGGGIANAKTGFQLNSAEFPIAANGIVKRTAANTYAAAVARTDYWDTTDMVGDGGGAGAHGLVPSPGSVAGTTKFLREDATWAVPAGGGGAPGGSNTQVQYNNSGAFGGIATATYNVSTGALTLASGGTNQNLTLSPSGTGTTNITSDSGVSGRNSVSFTNTNATSKSSQFAFYSSATPLFSFGNDSSTNGAQDFYIYDNVNTVSRIYFATAATSSGGRMTVPLATVMGWGGSASVQLTPDVGLARNAAGLLEVNNGTAGTFADVKVRTVIHNGYTVATLPTAVAGMVAYVTDGTAALAWGATVTGGSATKYLVWYNGTNWTVVGK